MQNFCISSNRNDASPGNQNQTGKPFKSSKKSYTTFTSLRQLNKAIARSSPDLILAELVYGFGNNYAGVNISNLDVSLYALQRYTPRARIIIVADKSELPHVSKLEELFSIDAVLKLPLTPRQLRLAADNLDE